MRKISLLLLVVMVVSLIATMGCTRPSASKEEAVYELRQQPDFKELVQYTGIRAFGILADSYVEPFDPIPNDFGKYDGLYFSHFAIYRTTSNTFKLVLLDHNRPTKIIATKEFK